MKKFVTILIIIGFVVTMCLALLSSYAQAGGRRCVDDHGIPHDCNIIYGNRVYDNHSSGRNHYERGWWRNQYPTHRHSKRHHRKHHDTEVLAGLFLGAIVGNVLTRHEPREYYEGDFGADSRSPVIFEEWEGPFSEGGPLAYPAEGDGGRIANWYTEEGRTTRFFEECRINEDQTAQCRGEVKGISLEEDEELSDEES